MVHLGAKSIVLRAEPEEVLELKAGDGGTWQWAKWAARRCPALTWATRPRASWKPGREFFAGRTVAQRTSAGVTGAVAAAQSADSLILGSYVTAAAIARYIQRLAPAPAVVSLVAMGGRGRQVCTPEDDGCADYIEYLLSGRPYDHLATVRRIVEHECTQTVPARRPGTLSPVRPALLLAARPL